MSGMRYWFSIPAVSLVAATAKTVIRADGGANHRVLIEQIGVYFNGTGPENDPVLVEMWRSTGGTMANTPAGGSKRLIDFDQSDAPQKTWNYNASAEPTNNTLLKQWLVHPQGGIDIILPIDRPVPIPGGDQFTWRCTAPQAVDVIFTFWLEE